MRWRWRLLLGFALWCAPSADALADKRVALVIGNSAYQHAPRLANPSNDATAVAKLIKDIGFDVVDFRRDLVGIELRRAIREFSQHAQGADIAIVFFAGHGIELNGANYLVPTDGKLEQEFDVDDEAVPLDRLLAAIEPARRLRLVILDACRDNPFIRRMKRTIATRAIGQGLAKVEPMTTDTLIAFAAKAGSIANDGDGPHSPFTTALLKHLATPGVDVRLVFGRVRDDVLASTKRKQEPFVYGSLGGSDVALVPSPAAPPTNSAGDVRRDYEAAERIGTLEAWDFFIAQYPTGFHTNMARAQRAKLSDAAARQDANRKRHEVERALAEAERQRLESAKTEREKADRETAEREARAGADEERKRADQAAQLKAEQEARGRREEAERQAKAAEAERERAQREEVARAEERRRLALERAKQENSPAAEPATAQVAMLPPAVEPVARQQPPGLPKGELVRAIKKELKRVGCYAGTADENWEERGLRRSIGQFVKYAKFSGAADAPNADFLDALRASDPGVCPLECGPRETERGGRCVAKTCPPDHRLSRGGACIDVGSRPGARHQPLSKRRSKADSEAARTKPGGGGKESVWRQCRREVGGPRGVRRFTMVDACVQQRSRM